jgi:hypothetical protein
LKLLLAVLVVAVSVVAGGFAASVVVREAAPAVALVAPSPKPLDSCACGGTVYVLFTVVSWPYRTPYSNGPAFCERHYSNGVVTYGPC